MSERHVTFMYPRGTYKTSTYYFRGDDELKEPEYLVKSEKDLRNTLKTLTKTLEREQKIYDQTYEELKKQDGFAVSLAAALGSESEATSEHAVLKRQLAELSERIDETEMAIKKLREKQQPQLLNEYLKERASYDTEIDNLRIKINDLKDQVNFGKEAVARIVCSDDFAMANIAQGLLQAKRQYHAIIRKNLSIKVDELNKIQGTGVLKTEKPKLSSEIEKLVAKKQELEAEKSLIERESQKDTLISQRTAESIISQIYRMNEILIVLGGQGIDTEALKKKYMDIDMTKAIDKPDENQNSDAAKPEDGDELIKPNNLDDSNQESIVIQNE